MVLTTKEPERKVVSTFREGGREEIEEGDCCWNVLLVKNSRFSGRRPLSYCKQAQGKSHLNSERRGDWSLPPPSERKKRGLCRPVPGLGVANLYERPESPNPYTGTQEAKGSPLENLLQAKPRGRDSLFQMQKSRLGNGDLGRKRKDRGEWGRKERTASLPTKSGEPTLAQAGPGTKDCAIAAAPTHKP